MIIASPESPDVDCHIDETDDPQSRCVEEPAARTIERGRQGCVTGSHVRALAGYDDVHAAKVIGLIAKAGMHVIANPAKALRLKNYGTEPGCQADLAVLPVDSIHEAFRLRVKPAAVLKRGKLVTAEGGMLSSLTRRVSLRETRCCAPAVRSTVRRVKDVSMATRCA